MESDNSRTNRRCKNSEGSLANYAIDEPEFTAKLGLDFILRLPRLRISRLAALQHCYGYASRSSANISVTRANQ
jgi:hypothetical protein